MWSGQWGKCHTSWWDRHRWWTGWVFAVYVSHVSLWATCAIVWRQCGKVEHDVSLSDLRTWRMTSQLPGKWPCLQWGSTLRLGHCLKTAAIPFPLARQSIGFWCGGRCCRSWWAVLYTCLGWWAVQSVWAVAWSLWCCSWAVAIHPGNEKHLPSGNRLRKHWGMMSPILDWSLS